MKTHEEIKRALECCVYHGSCKTCAYFGREGKCIGRLERDALDYIQQLENQIAELGRKVPKWIDVDARLPEKGEPVVALRRYEFAPDKYYLQFERYDPRSNMWQDGSVWHWLTLPEPPEGGTQ